MSTDSENISSIEFKGVNVQSVHMYFDELYVSDGDRQSTRAGVTNWAHRQICSSRNRATVTLISADENAEPVSDGVQDIQNDTLHP
jgi:hypothetical protein